ncbi:MAG: hypothetical protein ACLFVG_05110 [Candidatus Aminicenantes bacterium]
MNNQHLVSIRKKTLLLFALFSLVFLFGCVSHLREAKHYYAQGQKFSRSYRQREAVSHFKRALKEARLETERNPSSQAFMLKGLAELELELWEQAEESFLESFAYGFEGGQKWAQELSLLGLALSLEKLGLEDSAFHIYSHLVKRSKLKQILLVASQKFTEISLEKAVDKEAKQREKSLTRLLKEVEKLAEKDLSCGFYHYLLSQIHSHLSSYKQSFEQAVMARELGLPSQEILRDNDLQIVFCYQRSKQSLSPEEWEKFNSVYRRWMKKWNWPGPEIPDWKKR